MDITVVFIARKLTRQTNNHINRHLVMGMYFSLHIAHWFRYIEKIGGNLQIKNVGKNNDIIENATFFSV